MKHSPGCWPQYDLDSRSLTGLTQISFFSW